MIEFFLSRRVLANLLTVYPGASHTEVEALVTTRPEDEIRTVDGLEDIESFSVENLSLIVATVAACQRYLHASV